MMRALRVLVALLLALPPLSCFSEHGGVVEVPAGADCIIPGSAIGPNRAVVLIRNFNFSPDTLRVKAGTKVTWVNCEAATIEPHTSTSNSGAWESGPIAPGTTFSRDFTTGGINAYFCTPHPSMKGAIIVQ
jgi:plastocyanin